MQGGKNWILPKYINANRFFWDSHWLEIWSNHFCPSVGLNGGSVATDSNRQSPQPRGDQITDGWLKPDSVKEIWVRPISRSASTTSSQSLSCMERSIPLKKQ